MRGSLSSEEERVAQVENDKQCLIVQLADSQRELKHLEEKLIAEIQQKDSKLESMKVCGIYILHII